MNTAEQISDLNKEIEDLRKEWGKRCSLGKWFGALEEFAVKDLERRVEQLERVVGIRKI